MLEAGIATVYQVGRVRYPFRTTKEIQGVRFQPQLEPLSMTPTRWPSSPQEPAASSRPGRVLWWLRLPSAHRSRWAAKTSDYRAIDLAWLRSQRLLAPGHSGTLSWSRGGHITGPVQFRVEAHGLRLTYRPPPEPWLEVDEVVQFATTATAFSGERARS
jgi:hypothetical protein